ncbi:hypothetical protein Tco_0616205 [Tanacetum coccineum]
MKSYSIILVRIVNTKFTDVAQVANAARNMKSYAIGRDKREATRGLRALALCVVRWLEIVCDFWLGQEAFLGHIVAPDGITIDLAKVEAITKCSRPTAVRTFFILRIKDAKKQDGKLWFVLETLKEGKQNLGLMNGLIRYGNRLCVPDDSSLREDQIIKYISYQVVHGRWRCTETNVRWGVDAVTDATGNLSD